MSNVRVVLPMKETKEILDFVIALGKGIEDSNLDGDITLSDAGKFWPALESVLPALVDADKAIMEFGLAGAQEVEDLKAFVNEKVELHNKATEAFIEDGVSTILGLYLFVKKYFFAEPKETEDVVEQTESEVPVDIKEVELEDVEDSEPTNEEATDA